MARHYRNYKQEKRKREGTAYGEDKEPGSKPISSAPKRKKTNDLIEKYGVSIHACKRFAERVLGIGSKKLPYHKLESIAKYIRQSMPDELIDQSKMPLLDDYYAVVNGGVIVTIASRS